MGFRYFVRDRATEAGIDGWVRNLADGGVECLLQGPRHALSDLLRQLREGPPWAEVGDVEISWEEPRADLEGFPVLA